MRKILMLLIGLFSFSYSDNIEWKNFEESALRISKNNPKVKKLFAIAKADNNRLDENSTFDKAYRKSVREVYYTNYYQYGLEDTDNDSTYVYSVTFRMIMQGLGYLHEKDWKDLSNTEEMVWSVNALLKLQNEKLLTQREKNILTKKMLSCFEGKYNLKKQINATNIMVKLLKKMVEKRGLRMLWFSYSSDSQGFFIVKPEIYKQLNNKKLDENCSFSYEKVDDE